MTTKTRNQEDTTPHLVFFHEGVEGRVYRRETRLCPIHFEAFILRHPDAYGIGDRGGICEACGQQ